MFGEDYFHARMGLAHLAVRVLQLAEATGADKSPLENEDIAQGMVSPYLFVVCGESAAGKSSMLNAVFGEDVCDVSTSLDSSRVQWLRYGEKSRNEEVTALLEKCYRPVELLKRFNLMDTPGTNSGGGEQQKVIQQFLPVSDLIFWVVPVTNPWGASLWDLISKQSETTLQKSVIILQQIDLRDEKDLEIILGHVSDLARQRLAVVPPIFPVSAVLAMQSKLANPADEALWYQSGYPALEQYIADSVANSPVRQQLLVDIRKALADVLRNIEKAVEDRANLLEGHENFLRDLEAEVDVERRKHSADFVVKFAGMRDVFASKNKEMKRHVRRKLGCFSTLKSLFVAENTSKTIESSLVDLVEASVKAQAVIDGEHLVAECHKHWETVRPRVKKRFFIHLDDFDDKADGFDAVCEMFNLRMGRSARQAVLNLRIRKSLSPSMVARREHLKHWLYVCFTFLLAAGVTGLLKIGPYPWVPVVCIGVATLAMLGFALRVRLTAKKITKALGMRLEKARIPMAQAMEKDYKDGVRGFYIEYRSLLSSVRQHIFNAQQEHQPNLEQRNQLFLELMIIERDH